MEFGELVKVVSGKVLQKGDQSFRRVATDSRTVQQPDQTLFFAQSGPNHDGHDYLLALYKSGTRLFIVERESDLDLPQAGIILVEKSLRALQRLAIHHRGQFQYPVIGVTGSNGKTIIKEWLAMLLESFYKVVKSPKSYNSQLGVPLSVMEMSAAHNLAILEAGISKEGEMEVLAEVIQPNIGVFTNIGPAHDEGFADEATKIKEKAKLFVHCDAILCCHDHLPVRQLLEARFGTKVKSWSLHDEAASIYFQLKGNTLSSTYGSGEAIRIPFTEGPQLENLLHVLAVCLLLEIKLSSLEQALSRIRDIDMRLALKPGTNDCYLIDDSYNNDLSGLSVALNILDQQRQKTNKTLVLSDILQSAVPDEQLYREVNALLEKHQVNRLIGVGPRIEAARQVFSMPGSFFRTTVELINQLPVFQNEIILIKGARVFGLEKVVNILEEKHHGTSLSIHFDKVLHNLNAYRSQLNGTKVMAMVKAHAYGGGSFELANFLQYHHVDYLGVAYVNEGIDLRKNGLTLPIMVMNPEWDALPLFSTYQLEPEIYALEMLSHLITLGIDVPIHLKIETGMNRLGISPSEIEALVAILTTKNVRVKSVFTHLAAGEDPAQDDFTMEQVGIFEKAFERIAVGLGYAPMKHVLNSAGVVRWPQYHFDMVRPGIGLYGIDPTNAMELMPASTFKTRISQLKSIKKGATIGYERAGIAEKDLTIAILPVGYADGYRRSFGRGKMYVKVNGQRAYTIGNICMDMTMVDVTGIPAQISDPVTLFGEEPHIRELAECADTIPYEILTSISSRVKREYSWD